MEQSAKTHYENAKQELELAHVLVQPIDAAAAYRTAAEEMEAAGGYQDAQKLAKEYREQADRIEEQGKEAFYLAACRTFDGAKNSVQRKLAADMFERIAGYKDADALAKKCLDINRREVKKKDVSTALTVGAVALALFLGMVYWRSPMNAYRRAEELFAQERYEKAASFYEKADGYKDSEEKLLLCEEKAEETQ